MDIHSIFPIVGRQVYRFIIAEMQGMATLKLTEFFRLFQVG